jgi:hypothetical protein
VSWGEVIAHAWNLICCLIMVGVLVGLRRSEIQRENFVARGINGDIMPVLTSGVRKWRFRIFQTGAALAAGIVTVLHDSPRCPVPHRTNEDLLYAGLVTALLFAFLASLGWVVYRDLKEGA